MSSVTITSNFAIFGASNGSIRVYELLMKSVSLSPLSPDLVLEDQNNEQKLESLDSKESHLECLEVHCAVGGETPFSTHSGAVVVKALPLDHYNAPPHIFAAAWLDGRICVCGVATTVPDTASPCREWKVLKALRTTYSYFDVNFANFPVGPSVETHCSNGDNLSKCALIAVSHSGHVIMMPLLDSELNNNVANIGRELDSAVEQSRIVLCFNSSHHFKRPQSDTRASRSWQGSAALKSFKTGKTCNMYFNIIFS